MKRYRLQVTMASDRQWYVLLIAPNGEPVMSSETYSTKASAVRAAKELRLQVLFAKIVVEQTT